VANFFDPITGQDITRLDALSGVKFRIGLYGMGPAPNFDRLNVTTNPAPVSSALLNAKDSAVVFVNESPKGSLRFIYEIDPAKMQGDVVRACWNGFDYSQSVSVTFESMQEIRKGIVTLARSFVSTAHYLWGTAGNEPDRPNGNSGGGKLVSAKLRAYSLDNKTKTQETVLAVRTAVQPTIMGYNTCAGRCSLYTETPDLDVFVGACQGQITNGNTNQTTWEGAGNQKKLFPRKYHFRGSAARNGTVCWGDACDGVRHFDCVGLVNYCYAKYWYRSNFGLDICQYRDVNQGTSPMTGDKDLMDADILVKPDHHIGLLYDRGDGWYVVQAVDTNVGLSEGEKFVSSSWSRFRMQGAYLRGRHA
jgi:hypothetical protein